MLRLDTDKSGQFFRTVISGMEIVASIIITFVICIMMFNLICMIAVDHSLFEMTSERFYQFLADSLTLIVGLEFVNLLTRHRARDLVEVIMFAVARQIVVEHMDMKEICLGVAALAGLFAIRKYLLFNDKGEKGDALND